MPRIPQRVSHQSYASLVIQVLDRQNIPIDLQSGTTLWDIASIISIRTALCEVPFNRIA